MQTPHVRRFLARYLIEASFSSCGNIVCMKVALSIREMSNLSPMFHTKCIRSIERRELSTFERIGLYKSDCPYAKHSMFSCRISRSSFERNSILKNKDVYHVKNAIKLGQYNVGREGDILTIPLYMGFLVEDRLADVIIPDVDVSLLTTI